MIDDIDADFHSCEPHQRDWAETNYFGFYNAQAHLNVGVYALFRPNLGMVSSSVCMNSGRALTPWDADFCDYRAALPIPEPRSLLDYRLVNSLHVRCTKPNHDWAITYDDGEGTTIDVVYRALMPPFDINDPAQDPMCAAGSEAGQFTWGTAYAGHFDQTGHVVGEVSVRGKRYPIDCVSTMDHSWGPRPERGKPNMSWLHAHVDQTTALHAILGFDADDSDRTLHLAHGYVLKDGTLIGLAAGTGTVIRGPDRFPNTVELEYEDARGNFFDALSAHCGDEDIAAAATAHFMQLIRERYEPEFIPGIVDAVRALAAQTTLAVLSSNMHDTICRILRRGGIAACFSHVLSSDIERRKAAAITGFLDGKFAPNPCAGITPRQVSHTYTAVNVVMVTDTVGDVRDGIACGIEVYGVRWGMHGEHRLLDAGARHVFRAPEEITASLLTQPDAAGAAKEPHHA